VDSVRAVNTGNAIYLRIADRWSKGKQPVMKDIVIKNVYVEIPAGKPDAGYPYEGPVEDLPRNISPSGIVGLPGHHIENVTLENIELVYPGGGDPFYARVGLTPAEIEGIPEMPQSYPEFSQFKELPAWGFYIRHADGIKFKNVTLRAEKQDYRPAIVLDDVKNSSFSGMKVEEPNKEQDNLKDKIFQHRSESISIK
jgi:hypothetical protein